MKKIFFYCMAAILMGSCGTPKPLTDSDYRMLEKIDSRKFIFAAQTAIPGAGFKPRYLSYEYTLKVTPDSIISDLPYFGRAYSAPYNSMENGIKFASAKFIYTSTVRKEKRQIEITIQDTFTPVKLYLTIFSSGSTSLVVSDPNRQSITFDGKIE